MELEKVDPGMTGAENQESCTECSEELGATSGEMAEGMEMVEPSGKEDQSSCGLTGQGSTCSGTELENGLEHLFSRQRNEIKAELDNLQQTARPVTGDETRRQAVVRLVSRVVQPTADVLQTTAEPRPVQRPEHITVEVNALVERRPVTSMLGSQRFRQSIEDSLRGAVSSLQRRHRLLQLGRQETTAGAESAHADGVDGSLPAADVEVSSLPGSSDSSSFRDVRPSPPPAARVERAANWLRQQVEDGLPHELDPTMATAETLEQMQHETMIAEISELIQRQLVTTALDGSVRGRLERQMARRLQQSGTDGQRVLDFIRTLPRSDVRQRNDFFDLGIPAAQQDNMDDISVISATAAVAVPQAYSQSTTALSHEVRSLKTQMQELKQLLRLSFDLQLDIQRSIRQEVSAAVSTAIRDESAVADASSSRPVTDSGQCLICLDHPVDTVLYQCGHMCLCYTCGMRLRQQRAHCPVCRAPIRDIVRAYRSA